MSNFLSVLPSRLVSHVRKLIILMISLASLLLVTPFATAGLAEDIKADVKSIKNLVKDTKPLASNASKGTGPSARSQLVEKAYKFSRVAWSLPAFTRRFWHCVTCCCE